MGILSILEQIFEHSIGVCSKMCVVQADLERMV